MKLLIRTITFAIIGFYMILIILHCTRVEVIKHELEVATINSVYHTVDTYNKNAKLIEEGETTNLYFKTNEEYFDYFYDDVLVQLNGNIKVEFNCIKSDVETGDLDVDITVFYKGLDNKERSYMVHSDTYGRISDEVIIPSWLKSLIKEVSNLPVGSILKWDNYDWVLVENNEDNLVLLLNEDFQTSSYGNSVSYKNSLINEKMQDFENQLSEKSQKQLSKINLVGFETLSGVYMDSGTDALSEKIFALSKEQYDTLKELGYTEKFWLRTAASADSVYVGDNVLNISETSAIKPAVCINKLKLNDLIISEDSIILE